MASSLAILLLLLRFSGAIAVSSSYISRSTEQQIIATVAPAAFADADADGQSAAQPFLTSPSGSYAAFLRRAVDSGSSGGQAPAGGRDVCYVEIIQVDGGGSSVWESDCTPVGGADTCDLAFSPMGLELFAGGHSLWDTGVDADPGMLSLDGAGDMRIVNKDGVTVWKASTEPWMGKRCGAALPVSASPSTDVLPLPSTTSAKLLTPPVMSLANPWGSDFTFGDQTAPPVDTPPDQPLPPPPADASTDWPDLPLPPPPADPSTDWPDLPLPPPPADPSTDSPDLPLPPPPADTSPIPDSPDQPLYSSPPPAPTAFGSQTPLPPLDTPPLAPPTSSGVAGVASPGAPPLPGIIATPPGSSGDDMAFPPPPVGTPNPHGPPHQLPLGASSPALAPGSHAGAGAGLPFGQGQQQRGQGQGVFGQQQNQVLNGAGQPLDDSSGEHGGAAVSLVFVGLMALAFGF